MTKAESIQRVAAIGIQQWIGIGGHAYAGAQQGARLVLVQTLERGLIDGLAFAERMEETSSWQHPVDLPRLIADADAALTEALTQGQERLTDWDGHRALAESILDDEPDVALRGIVEAARSRLAADPRFLAIDRLLGQIASGDLAPPPSPEATASRPSTTACASGRWRGSVVCPSWGSPKGAS